MATVRDNRIRDTVHAVSYNPLCEEVLRLNFDLVKALMTSFFNVVTMCVTTCCHSELRILDLMLTTHVFVSINTIILYLNFLFDAL